MLLRGKFLPSCVFVVFVFVVVVVVFVVLFG